MIFKRTILFIATIILVQVGIAQVGATIKATVNKNKILLGEPFVLSIKASMPLASNVRFIKIDSIPHFEFLEATKIDSIVKDEEITITGLYTITSFDSGHWVIPSYAIAKGVKSDTIPIDVVFSDFDPEQEYHDIKDILEVKVPRKKFAWWIYAACLVILISLLAFLTRKKSKPTVITAQKITISPFEEAMKELSQLEKDRPESKDFHYRLVHIFRLYIFRKKGILSLQKTTDDLVIQLTSLNLDKEQFEKLLQTLRLSDYVKFAKYESTKDDDNLSFAIIKNTITMIEQSE